MTPTTEPTRTTGDRGRWIAFGAVCVAAVVIAAAGILLARRERDERVENAEPVVLDARGMAAALGDDVPDLLFESTAIGDTYGFLATVPAGGSSDARAVGELECERVDFRSGRGVCLRADRGMATTYDAVIFDEQLAELGTVGLAGSPSRVRLSPRATLAGTTVFVSGHSYADTGFSTQTTLLDVGSGEVIADLETDFTVRRDGAVWREVDFNFWGVTFVDEQNFYATLGTGGEHYLVDGDVDARELSIVTDGVECPSLSPDGTRIAYKARIDDGLGPITWRIEVLDLATMQRTRLAETRSVDDQVAWLDDETIMYGLPSEVSPAVTDTWLVPADGSGEPRLLIEGAWSATAVAADPAN